MMKWRVLGCALGWMAIGAVAQTPNKPAVTVKAAETVTVNADRGLVGINDLASSVAVLTQDQMQTVPGLALDDKLHQVAGFQLFRRTSSWTANPTTQGVSLRGLGSTAASRTLVVSEEVPLNDPFGGWVHWDEVPALAIGQVRLLRGGAADLYGSSAIGGVVEAVPVTAAKRLVLSADASGATENSGQGDLLVSDTTRWAGLLGAYSGLRTGGYIPIAAELRGPVDVPSNVASDSGRVVLSKSDATGLVHGFLMGNLLNESRSNGTRMQTNATRLWRYVGGVDANGERGNAAVRVFGSRESYRQSFSSVTSVMTQRDTETLTKLQHVPLDEFGFVVNASRAVRPKATAAMGVDMRDVRATDDETSTTVTPQALTSIGARQRAVGGYADAIWQPGPWSLSGSVRVDSFRTFDARKVLSTAAKATQLPELDELFVSPHVGVVRRLPHGFALTGTAFRAFRGPTMNELYRTGQVGQQTTLANNSLLAERATGFEFGGEADGSAGHMRATYFWTEVNRPISAVALSQTATTQTLQRQNLGQIRSRGMMLEAQSRSWHALDAGVGYQLAVATVTAFNATSAVQGNLLGKWIPEVARESVTATVNYNATKVLSVHLIASYSGREYDDAANTFVLSPFARIDVSAERQLVRGLSVFAGAQNLLNRKIDAGLTPLLTLAAPRLVQAGLRYRFGR
jgi:outer membrane receptor protein involved in Fe transport